MEFIDHKKLHLATRLNLSILWGDKTFSCLVRDVQGQIIAYLDSISVRDPLPYSLRDIFNKSLEQVRWMIADPVFTLIPKNQFKPQSAASNLRDLAILGVNQTVGYNGLRSVDMKVLFPAIRWEKTPFAVQEDKEPKPHDPHDQNHILSVLDKGMQRQLDRVKQPHVLLTHVIDEKAYFMLYKDGALVYAHAFRFETPEDFLYFTLFVIDTFYLKRKNLQLYLSGQVQLQSKIGKLLKSYIPHVDEMPSEDEKVGLLSEIGLSSGQRFIWSILD